MAGSNPNPNPNDDRKPTNGFRRLDHGRDDRSHNGAGSNEAVRLGTHANPSGVIDGISWRPDASQSSTCHGTLSASLLPTGRTMSVMEIIEDAMTIADDVEGRLVMVDMVAQDNANMENKGHQDTPPQ